MSEIKNTNIEKQDDEISLKEMVLKFKEWIFFLKSKWLIISIVGILGGGGGFVYAFIQKPAYTANLSFALEDEKSGSGFSGALGLASSLGLDLGTNVGGAFSGANLMELMKSRTLIERSLLDSITVNGKLFSLAEYYIAFSGLRNSMNKNPVLANIHFYPNENRSNYSLAKDSLLGEIYKRIAGDNTGGLLSVTQKDKKISIISVEVKSTDEQFSKTLTELVVKEVAEFYIDTKSKKAKTNVFILQKQADSIRSELNSAISGVAAASDQTFNLNPALNIKRTPSTRRQVDVQANTAILTQLVTNLEMAKVTLLKETPLIQIIDKPILPLKKEQYGKLKFLILGVFLSTFLFVLFLSFWKVFQGLLK